MFKLRLQAKTRITLAQVSLASAVVMLGLGLGLIPDHRADQQNQRASLCESVAWTITTLVQEARDERIDELLDFTVRRNQDLLSAGIRVGNRLTIEVGNHAANWPDNLGTQSRDGFVHIPIYEKSMELGTWGSLEMRFAHAPHRGVLAQILTHPWTRFAGFFSVLSFVGFRWYLGRVFNHLDPQKAVPQRVRSAYDFLTGGLVALDKSQRIVLANRAFASMVNQPRESLIGLSLSSLDVFQQLEGDASRELPWASVHQTKEPHLGTTLNLKTDGAKSRSLMVNAAPVIGQDGQYRGVLVGFDDVTLLEDAKAALKKSKESAEETSAAKSAFLANMSHEIRTPMNSILGFADIMRRGFAASDAERQEYLNIIHSSGQHLLDLINDILDLSKVEAGRMELECIPCQPHQIIKDVIAIFRVRAREKDLNLSFSVEGQIPDTIRADPLRLRQILTNLVGNAIKFTESGSVTVVARMQDDGKKMAFDVIDTGIGITPAQADKIFNPFSQADSSTTRKFGGTGLGLPISRKLAEMMGGTIVAAPSEQGGSCFTVTVDPGDLTNTTMITLEDINTSVEPVSCESEDYQLPPGRILVVDDGDTNRRLIQLVLERAGVTVGIAVNGAEAIERATQDDYDVILMDVMMPVMDGYEATARLRERGMTLPIVALTAHAMKEERQRALENGFDEFVTKPVNIDLLLKVVAKCLGGEVTTRPRTETVSASADSSQADSTAGPANSQKKRILCSLPMDDEEFLEIAMQFRERLGSQLEAMALSWAAKDFGELAKQAHWLKGAGGTAGFDDFSVPAKQLERAAKDNNHELCEQWLDALRAMSGAIWLPDQATLQHQFPSDQLNPQQV